MRALTFRHQAAWLSARLIVLGLSACTSAAQRPAAAPSPPVSFSVSACAWPVAAARFRPPSPWLGADGAYSIDLAPRRVLWLFADTFIDPQADGSRQNGPNFLIRNSVAIQTGPDPQAAHDLSRSTLSFHWGPVKDSAPSSFFRDIDAAQRWIWPLHGALLPDGRLLLFRMQVTRSTGGFGFALDSWDAVAIDDPTQPPEHWRPRPIAPATKTFGKLVGSSVLIHAGYLYAYAVENREQDHGIFLARWPMIALLGLHDAALANPDWFTDHGFERQDKLVGHGTPARLFAAGQVEFSVHFDESRQRFVQVQMNGLFLRDAGTQLALRTAPHPEGPWSQSQPFFRPPEHALANASDLVAYAGKAHPEQRGADGIVTYVVNDVNTPTPPDNVYYPQPLRLAYDGAANGCEERGAHARTLAGGAETN